MVRCFLIHTVCPVSALGPGESRVLYSRVFGPDESIVSEQNRGLNPEERRLLQKEKVAVVARQVRSAVSLSREASGRPLVETVPGEEALALQEADSGVVRLRAGDPFNEEMSALWLGVQSLGFTLVCESYENLLLAEGTLRNLTRHCLEHLHMLGQGSESTCTFEEELIQAARGTCIQAQSLREVLQRLVQQHFGEAHLLASVPKTNPSMLAQAAYRIHIQRG